MDDFLGYVATALGQALNGVLQVITDFVNLVIEMLPNPDPFPEIIENLPDSTTADMGFAFYWADSFFGIDVCTTIISAWVAMMIASAVFAFVYWVVKAIKP